MEIINIIYYLTRLDFPTKTTKTDIETTVRFVPRV